MGKWSIIILCLAGLLAACGAPDNGTGDESGGTAEVAPDASPVTEQANAPTPVTADPQAGALPSPTAADLVPTPTPPPEPVVVMGQSGGIAGVMNEWKIYDDGSITAGGGPVARVPREAVAELLNTIWQAGFFEMEETTAKAICCDFFVYTLTVRLGATERTHAFSDGDEAAADSVRLATVAVQDFLAAAMFE